MRRGPDRRDRRPQRQPARVAGVDAAEEGFDQPRDHLAAEPGGELRVALAQPQLQVGAIGVVVASDEFLVPALERRLPGPVEQSVHGLAGGQDLLLHPPVGRRDVVSAFTRVRPVDLVHTASNAILKPMPDDRMIGRRDVALEAQAKRRIGGLPARARNGEIARHAEAEPVPHVAQGDVDHGGSAYARP